MIGPYFYKKILQVKPNLHYTRAITPKRVTSGGAHLRGLISAWATQLQRNIPAVASRWRHCVLFDWPGIQTQDLPHRQHCRTVAKRTSCRYKRSGFDSLAGQIVKLAGEIVIAATFLWSCVAQALIDAEMGPATRYTFQRNIASKMKI